MTTFSGGHSWLNLTAIVFALRSLFQDRPSGNVARLSAA
jgi:hypothetical protein